MSDELRALILEGIDEEIATGCEDWNDPQERIDSLKDFRTRVEAYPAAGGTVDLPHQRGLFDMMAEKIVIPGNSNTK